MRHQVDMSRIGEQHGALTVINKVRNAAGRWVWVCQCECGNTTLVTTSQLIHKRRTTCGKAGCPAKRRYSHNVIDETGKTYGYLTVLRRSENNSPAKIALWVCQCQCGNIVEVDGYSLRSGHTKSCGCYQKEQVAKACFKDVTGQTIGNFTVLRQAHEHYDGRTIKWQARCNLCGNEEVYISVSNMRSQHSCGCVQESKGNRAVRELLESNNIQYIAEKRFSDLKFDTGHSARYDFYLPELNTIIEYDGVQHFLKGNGVFDNHDKFLLTQEHDRIKNEYCFKNNINLIRIPYTHYNDLVIEDLLPDTSQFLLQPKSNI